MTNENKKKAITSLLVVVITLIGLVISSAFAYFAADTSNSFGTKSITAEAESAGSVALNGTNATIMLNLSESDMRKDTNDITYWGTSTGDPSITQNVVTIGSTSVSGGKTYNCSYSGSVTASGTNNMYTAFQSMTGKSADQIVLKIGENTYDFNTANLFPISISGTLNGITSSNVANITAEFYLVNKSNVNQTDLAGTDISITVSVTNFSCTVPMPPSAAETLIELAQEDDSIVKYEGKVTDDVTQIGEGTDADNVYTFTSNNVNNMVFAGHCWQIRRTTETGGVKLQYNGEPIVTSSNNETNYYCGPNRPYKMAEIGDSVISTGSTYLYGSGYTTSFDGTTTTFTLTNTQEFTVNSANHSTVIRQIAENYPYYCANTTGTCTNGGFYKINGEFENEYVSNDTNNAYGYRSVPPDAISTTSFNIFNNKQTSRTVAGISYKYGNVYFDEVINAYETFRIYSDNTTNLYLISDGILEMSNGTMKMTGNVVELNEASFKQDISTYRYKFMCTNYSYDMSSGSYYCSSNLYYIQSSSTSAQYTTVNTNPIYKYGYFFEQNGNSYNLIGDGIHQESLQYIYNINSTSTSNCFDNNSIISKCGYDTMNYNFYTCFNLSGICDTYYHLNSILNNGTGTPKWNAERLNGGVYINNNLSDANNSLRLMLVPNTHDSSVKDTIDEWYEENILNTPYEMYIDSNAIFCNNRVISNYIMIDFAGSTNNSLNCSQLTDSFSVSNNDARLEYPIALMTKSELNILGNNSVRAGKATYFTMTPIYHRYYVFSSAPNNLSNMATYTSSGSESSLHYEYPGSIRPAIVLNSSAVIGSGTGAIDDPFIIVGSEMTP